jgi:hypothetical protein
MKGFNTDWEPLKRNWGDNWELTLNILNLVGQAFLFNP